MNRLHLVLLLLLSVFMTAVQAQQRVSDNQMKANMGNNTIRELLSKGDVTVEMEDYGNMEKVGPLGTSLPRNDRQTSTGPGDIILYQGKYLVIYYSTNSWNFTRIGKIDNTNGAQLKSALGNGDVTVTLSLGK